MNNRRFILKVLNGKFKMLNLYVGMKTDLYTILDLFDGADQVIIDKYPEGYRIKITNSDFYAKFIELENY